MFRYFNNTYPKVFSRGAIVIIVRLIIEGNRQGYKAILPFLLLSSPDVVVPGIIEKARHRNC